MKQLVKAILFSLLIIPSLVTGQSVFDKFENSDRIGTVSINKGMLGILSSISVKTDDQDTKDFIDMAKSINSIKVFISEDEKAAAEISATTKKYVRSSKLESLMKVKEDDTQVDFYVREGKDDDHVREMVMLVTGIEKHTKHSNIETVLVTMTGDIDLRKIGALVNKMDLPKDLEKAGRK